MKPRVFFLTPEAPRNTMGGEITFYRQFILTTDYDLFVATDQDFHEPGVPSLILRSNASVERLKRTRLTTWFHDYANLVQGNRIDASVLRAARTFQPDIIYTVAGSFWQARMARSLAKRLRLPLAAHFMDWSTFNFTGHAWAYRAADRQYRQFYRDCDLAFCICEGMKKELGPHPNAHVHYPICADASGVPQPTEPSVSGRFRITFAGNLGEWYGEMLRGLVSVISPDDGIDFRIYGKFHKWPVEFERRVVAQGVYRGFLPFDELNQELANTDALFLMMGFGREARLIESTSFKTKFLEYLPFQKPILVWGPEYSTAVLLAKKHGAALTCCSPDPQDALKAILALRRDLPLQERLVTNANRMFGELFDPRKTKTLALERFQETIEDHRGRRGNGIVRIKALGRLKTTALRGMSLFRPRALILVYHRVTEPINDPHMLCVSPPHFEEQLAVLRHHCRPMSLQDLVRHLEKGQLPGRAVVLTFDDGYIDNLVNAKPILEKYEIPATVFVTSGLIGAERGLWDRDLAEILFEPNTLPDTLSLEVGRETHEWRLAGADYENRMDYQRHRRWTMDGADIGPRETVHRALHGLLRPLPQETRVGILARLARWAGVQLEAAPGDRILAAAELLRLVDGGLVDVGAHTVTHPVLSTLPADEQRREIHESKAQLEAILGQPVSSFAYPYGTAKDFHPDTISLIRQGGFSCACCAEKGSVAPNVNRFWLPRVTIANWDGDTFARVLSESFLL